MTSISWVICCMEREQFVSADAGYQGRHSARELAEDVDWLIAERPGKVRTLKQHPRKNKTAINIEYMKAKASGPRWKTPISHHQATVRLRESQIQKGLLKTITNWRCYSLANLVSGGPNDTSVGEISLKNRDNRLKWRRNNSK